MDAKDKQIAELLVKVNELEETKRVQGADIILKETKIADLEKANVDCHDIIDAYALQVTNLTKNIKTKEDEIALLNKTWNEHKCEVKTYTTAEAFTLFINKLFRKE